MESKRINIIITQNDEFKADKLRHYLEYMFRDSISIEICKDGKSCIDTITGQTNMVILDYMLDGQNSAGVFELIRLVSPETEILMLTDFSDLALDIESYLEDAEKYAKKKARSWKVIARPINYLGTEPMRYMVKAAGMSKLITMLLMSFATLGITVFYLLHFLKH